MMVTKEAPEDSAVEKSQYNGQLATMMNTARQNIAQTLPLFNPETLFSFVVCSSSMLFIRHYINK